MTDGVHITLDPEGCVHPQMLCVNDEASSCTFIYSCSRGVWADGQYAPPRLPQT